MADLHHIIQIAMSWDNDHLHCFHIYGEDYGLKYDGGMDFNHNARQLFLDDFGFDVGDRFSYTYDFTAYWLCDIRVEAIEPISTVTPRCFGGVGAKVKMVFGTTRQMKFSPCLTSWKKWSKLERPPLSAS